MVSLTISRAEKTNAISLAILQCEVDGNLHRGGLIEEAQRDHKCHSGGQRRQGGTMPATVGTTIKNR